VKPSRSLDHWKYRYSVDHIPVSISLPFDIIYLSYRFRDITTCLCIKA